MKYDFKCKECGTVFELQLSIAEYESLRDKDKKTKKNLSKLNTKCPKCNSTKLSRVYSSPAISCGIGGRGGCSGGSCSTCSLCG